MAIAARSSCWRRRLSCAVLNAGDGAHEHPTQALLDALSIRRRLGKLQGLRVAICGDIAHSRVARSNLLLLNAMGAQVHLIGPQTLYCRSALNSLARMCLPI